MKEDWWCGWAPDDESCGHALLGTGHIIMYGKGYYHAAAADSGHCEGEG